MMNHITSVFFVIFVCLLLIGRFRIYLRTGLKGELLITIGGTLLIFGFILDNILLEICGFIVLNIGLIVLTTIESAMRKDIFGQTTVLERLLGNVPIIKKSQYRMPVVRKDIGIYTGIVCLILSIVLYKKLTTYDILEITFIGILASSGIFFIVFSIFKGTPKGE